jgi:hypothetical protein
MEAWRATRILATLETVIAASGIAAAVYCLLSGMPELALHIVTLSVVGAVGLVSFASDFIDIRNGAGHEAGFANLAFALAAITAFFLNWGVAAEAAIVLGFALYLVQTMLFLTWQVAASHDRRLWYRIGAYFLCSVMLLIFVVTGLQAAGLPPFGY